MPTVVVPFRGESAKRRLAPAPEDVRATLANAMLEDVLATPAGAVAEDVVVASAGGGQGAAVEIALKRVDSGPILVVNADLPAAQPRDLLTLLGALPEGGLALVAAQRRNHQCARTRRAAPVRTALRPRERRALPGPGDAPGRARCRRRDPEPRRRRRHAGRPRRARGTARPAHSRRLRRAAHRPHAVKVVVLAGGLGGSRFARALAETIDPGGADDRRQRRRRRRGVRAPRLARSRHDPLHAHRPARRGARLGRRDETWNALGEAGRLGAETWFQLGDRDLGLHLVRTERLRAGETLSSVTRELAAAFGLEPALLPATDDRLRTWLETPAGEFPFQEWFVGRQHRDEVDGVRFEGAEDATRAGSARGAGRSAT